MTVTSQFTPSLYSGQAVASSLASDNVTVVPTSAANPFPVSVVSGGSNSQIVTTQYQATATATGYNTGDIISHILELTLGTPSVIVNSTWTNATQGTVLASAPASANIAQIAGGVTVSNFPTTQAVSTADGSDVTLGAKADAAYAGSGSASVVAALKGVYAALVAPLPAGTNNIGVTQPATSTAAVLTSGTAYNYTNFSTIRVQVDSLSGGDTVTFAGSAASGGTTYPLQQILNTQNGQITQSVTTSGVYVVLFSGGLYLTPTHNGSSSTPTITASASQ